MENQIVELLNKEIEKTLEDVAKATDMEACKALTAKLSVLHNQRMKELDAALKEQQRFDNDYAKTKELGLKEAELEVKRQEVGIKEAELQEAKKGRRTRTVLDILGIAVPTMATGYWMWQGMKFEEEGKIFSSRTTRWLSEHLRLFGKKG